MKIKNLYAVLCIENVEQKKTRVYGTLETLIPRREELIKKGFSACILVNTREHCFDYIIDQDTEFIIPKSGFVLKAKVKTKEIGYSGGIKFISKKYKQAKTGSDKSCSDKSLPVIDGVYWIISSIIGKTVALDRKDFILANTVNTETGTKCNSFVMLNV